MTEGKSEGSSPDPVTPPESPERRRLFAVLGLGSAAAAGLALLGAASRVVLAPLLASARGTRGGIDVGEVAAFDATREGRAGPQEIVIARTVDDGYMTRKVKERYAVVADASSPAGIAALSTTCSHLGCGVSWSDEKKAFLCPCHGGVYDATGKVVSGPPPRPLRRLPLTIEGGRVRLDPSALETA
ncbi:MAG TPA: Rieske 2Fe-2S domain-containing protein [Thermoanaerobaculia bacterium]|jgi:Rieske Fe-S protein|nr:Rieske 2Fe-2S domain-containing protein [Thermoanaerobaculia bacterium]